MPSFLVAGFALANDELKLKARVTKAWGLVPQLKDNSVGVKVMLYMRNSCILNIMYLYI